MSTPTVAPRYISEILNDRILDIEVRIKNPHLYRPIPTGLPELDDAIGGIVLPSVVALAGRKKIGKTLFAVHLANAIALSEKMITEPDGTERPLKIVSYHLEEVQSAYADRILTSKTDRVTRPMIRDLKLTQEDIDDLRSVIPLYSNVEFLMSDHIFNIDEIIRTTIAIGADVQIIDTLNLVEGGVGTNGQEKQASVSKALIRARNDHNITTIAVHHLNAEGRSFGSESTDRDADLILHVSQPDDIVFGDSMESVLRIETQDSRQAKGGVKVDCQASFSQSRLFPLPTKTIKFPLLGKGV